LTDTKCLDEYDPAIFHHREWSRNFCRKVVTYLPNERLRIPGEGSFNLCNYGCGELILNFFIVFGVSITAWPSRNDENSLTFYETKYTDERTYSLTGLLHNEFCQFSSARNAQKFKELPVLTGDL
jgi:hypothetical protein